MIDLTQREDEVAQLLAQGLSHYEAGEKLFITKSAISQHAVKIIRKADEPSMIKSLLKLGYLEAR